MKSFTILLFITFTALLNAKSQERVSPVYAKGFRVEYGEGYKLVTVHNPATGEMDLHYLLTEKNCPHLPLVPEGTIKVAIPLKRFVAMSATYVEHVKRLLLWDELTGFPGPSLTSNTKLREKMKTGQVHTIGSELDPEIEAIIKSRANAVFTYSTGNLPQAYQTVQRLGIPVILNSEYLESHPLGYAEWIKFTSLFFNRESLANRFFKLVQERYQYLKKLASTAENSPSVFVNLKYADAWFVPGKDSFVATFINDAKGKYIFSDTGGRGSKKLAFEAVLSRAANADLWLNPGNCLSLEQLAGYDPRYKLFKAFQSGRVYNHSKEISEGHLSSYFESALSNPHILLEEIIAIFHPELLPSHDFRWYENLK
jgi:iron complex transport system substrate-binding protein